MNLLFKRKQGLVYDWMDFILSLVFLGIGIFIAFLLIAANRMNTVDTKYELVERVEIMDHATYFLNLPVTELTFKENRLSAAEREYLETVREEGLYVYDLFSRRMVSDDAQELLAKAIEENPIFSKYKITLSAIDTEDTHIVSSEQLKEEILTGDIIRTTVPTTQVTGYQASFETDLRCGLDESIKEVTFSLPLPLHYNRETQSLTIQYCHSVKYFERA